jgi:hypothetical protein
LRARLEKEGAHQIRIEARHVRRLGDEIRVDFTLASVRRFSKTLRSIEEIPGIDPLSAGRVS